VEVCPTQARIFGDARKQASPLRRLLRMAQIQVLKPYLNTKPKVFYTNLDGEVR
jgi:Fe-S-cluster-containing dehydrogenase component